MDPEANETDLLLADNRPKRRNTVKATSTGGPLQKTANALIESEDEEECELGLVFLRRVYALTFMQYTFIFIMASPFALEAAFKPLVESNHVVLEAVAIVGIVSSFALALTKGTIYPFAHVALVSLTVFVGLEIGISLSSKSWGDMGLLALAEATTNFAVILAILQFDARSLRSFTFPVAVLLCLILSSFWMLVMVETGQSWKVAAIVAVGAWAFTIMNVFCSWYVAKEVAPEEYIMAVLFMLFPEALLFLAANERHPEDDEDNPSVDC